jgi:hypothetical protein
VSETHGVSFHRRPGYLTVSGLVDSSNSEQLVNRICEEARQGPFVLDTTEATFRDPAAMTAVLMAAQRLDGCGPFRIRPSLAAPRFFYISR